MRIPRTRGAISGLTIAVLGLWGALIPFIGPSFDYAIGSTSSWHWSAGRFWLSVLPGVVAIVGGLLLTFSANRPTASFGAMLGVAAGAWFVVGPSVSAWWNHGVSQAGVAHGSTTTRVLAELGWFYALGALILYFAATALGRLSVRALRDIELAEEDAAVTAVRRRRAAETTAATAGTGANAAPDAAGGSSAAGETPLRPVPPASAPAGSAPAAGEAPAAPTGTERPPQQQPPRAPRRGFPARRPPD
jgi:hypothetical protein